MKFNTNLFEGVSKKTVSKSRQDLSYEWKDAFDPGSLIPFLMVPTLPGDDFTEIESQFFFKFEPLHFPVIHRMQLEADIFWCPYRVMWPTVKGDSDTGWENWIMLKNSFSPPTVAVDMAFVNESSGDSVMGYLGIPYVFDDGVQDTLITGLNAFGPMMYLLCWDEYYRNVQVEDVRGFNLVNGDNTAAMAAAFGFSTPTDVSFSVLPAKWPLDYLTAGLLQPQVDSTVQIPLVEDIANFDYPTSWKKLADGTDAGAGTLVTTASGDTQVGPVPVGLDIQETAGTILQLGNAERIQRFRERLMKIGQRFRDYVIGIFDEDPTPMDIDIPIMIGSYKGTVNVSEVLTQANVGGETDLNTGQYAGNMALFESQTNTIRFKCRDHGLIMGIMSLVPNTGYGQGINRWWRYDSPYDYPMDTFSSIGDQEVLKEEVMYNAFPAEASKNQETFSYVPRFSEARTMLNHFGSSLAWKLGIGLSTHMGMWFDPSVVNGAEYDDTIQLDQYFISCNIRTGGEGGLRGGDIWRVLTFPNGATASRVCIGYVYNKIIVNRPLPMYSTPSLV